jgi:hypothetical protein
VPRTFRFGQITAEIYHSRLTRYQSDFLLAPTPVKFFFSDRYENGVGFVDLYQAVQKTLANKACHLECLCSYEAADEIVGYANVQPMTAIAHDRIASRRSLSPTQPSSSLLSE